MQKFSSKAETLAHLEGALSNAVVLPQVRFSVAEWHASNGTLDVIGVRPDWLTEPVIVRSSAQAEDSEAHSMAGHFTSVPHVHGDAALLDAVQTVVASMQGGDLEDQVFIQPMLDDVRVSGVAFSRDPSTGGHYHIINYDDHSGSTDTVTGGGSNELSIHYHAKDAPPPEGPWLKAVVRLLNELEDKFNHDALDIEFAVTGEETVALLQLRPLVMHQTGEISSAQMTKNLGEIEARIRSLSAPHPYLFGRQSIYGVMPDWNPAEIIGARPRPLALSLYKALVTDSVWAYQRDNYGYRNLRSFPLMVSFSGLPYIDVRISFNSFIPCDLDENIAERLVNYYTDRLLDNPNLHDKVEFDIIFSCYTLDLFERLKELDAYGFGEVEQKEIAEKLRALTNNIIHGVNGLWKGDVDKIEELRRRHDTILSSNLTSVEKAYWLTEDCKRYGTLPFAGLARAGFIAVQMLKSMVRTQIISEHEYGEFMNALDTVSSRMARDFAALKKEDFLLHYGHLRPGTYDILSPRYDEEPDQYFDWGNAGAGEGEPQGPAFALSAEAAQKLEAMLISHGLDHDVDSLMAFIKSAIEGREYAKFVFSKSLSDVLVLMRDMGDGVGHCVDDVSYADIDILHKLYASADDIGAAFSSSISEGKERYAKTSSLSLPPLITKPEDVWSFALPENEPNYITLLSVRGEVVTQTDDKEKLKGAILMIPSADPGFDWVFSHDIGGFITMYGGANSHMSIRASELGIPAVIGAGEALYRQWSNASVLSIDCANKQVRVLK